MWFADQSFAGEQRPGTGAGTARAVGREVPGFVPETIHVAVRPILLAWLIFMSLASAEMSA